MASASNDGARLVEGLELQRIGFEFNLGNFTQENPFLAAFDTNSTPVTGKVVYSEKDKLRVDLSLPGDLTAA